MEMNQKLFDDCTQQYKAEKQKYDSGIHTAFGSSSSAPLSHCVRLLQGEVQAEGAGGGLAQDRGAGSAEPSGTARTGT